MKGEKNTTSAQQIVAAGIRAVFDEALITSLYYTLHLAFRAELGPEASPEFTLGSLRKPDVWTALDKAEAEKEAVIRQIEQADQEIADATVARPTTAQVQASWAEILRVWEVLTEDERIDLMGSVVQVVEMTEKESMTLKLLPVPYSTSSYSNGFALKSEMGAERKNTYTLNPAGYGVPVFVPSGGKCRTKVPRPERRKQTA